MIILWKWYKILKALKKIKDSSLAMFRITEIVREYLENSKALLETSKPLLETSKPLLETSKIGD